MDRRDFLSISAAAAFAAAIPAPALAADPLNFRRWRRPLISFNEDQLKRMREIIEAHIRQPGIVSAHRLLNGAHGVGTRRILGHLYEGFGGSDGEEFFMWHRRYLAPLEQKLRDAGLEAASWAPWERIPGVFRTHGNANPDMGRRDFAEYSDEAIGHFEDVEGLGVSLSWGPHFETHVRTRGDMMRISTTAGVPLFWPWHGFVDDLFRTWEAVRQANGGNPPQRPRRWPFEGRGEPQAGTGSNRERVHTPFVMGQTIRRARQAIEGAGLRFQADTGNDDRRVLAQNPLPWTHQTRDVVVSVRTRL